MISCLMIRFISSFFESFIFLIASIRSDYRSFIAYLKFDLLFGNNSHIYIDFAFYELHSLLNFFSVSQYEKKINLFLFITLELFGVKLFLYCNRNVVSCMLSVLILYFVSMNFTRYFNFTSNSLRLKN